MTPRALARALGPYVGPLARPLLAELIRGKHSIALRYDWVHDWSVIEKLIANVDEVHFFDGEEWFLLALEPES